MKNDYINFETSELLSIKEIKVLVSNSTPLFKANLLALKLWGRIMIMNNRIYIKYGKETYDASHIDGNNMSKYVSIMTRKLVDQSICKYINKSNRDLYSKVLQRSYYEDILDDIEYMLIWDNESDDDESDDDIVEPKPEDDDDESDDDIVEPKPEDDEDDDEDNTYKQFILPKNEIYPVDTIKGIMNFL